MTIAPAFINVPMPLILRQNGIEKKKSLFRWRGYSILYLLREYEHTIIIDI